MLLYECKNNYLKNALGLELSGFPVDKNLLASEGHTGSIPGLGRSSN